MTFKSKKDFYKNNGKLGGRPKQDSNIHNELPDLYPVILTAPQYNILLKRYGMKLLNSAIEILRHWLLYGGKASEKYHGKNNYAHFRVDGWVINEAKNCL